MASHSGLVSLGRVKNSNGVYFFLCRREGILIADVVVEAINRATTISSSIGAIAIRSDLILLPVKLSLYRYLRGVFLGWVVIFYLLYVCIATCIVQRLILDAMACISRLIDSISFNISPGALWWLE
jgi:hypothetical protein